jgi:hypothetical protein
MFLYASNWRCEDERERERREGGRDVHFFGGNKKGSCYNKRKVARGPHFNGFSYTVPSVDSSKYYIIYTCKTI